MRLWIGDCVEGWFGGWMMIRNGGAGKTGEECGRRIAEASVFDTLLVFLGAQRKSKHLIPSTAAAGIQNA